MPKTIKAFITEQKIRMSATWADANPNMSDMPGWSHWRCVFRRGNRSLTTYFSQGPAISREPTAEDVLDCLASDAAGYINAGDFENWASESGYDTDSRKAERTYKAVKRGTQQLERFLGYGYLQELCFKIERQ